MITFATCIHWLAHKLPVRAARTLALVLVSIALPLHADTATIHLNDGSQLQGEVLSLKGGNYKVRTNNLGVIDLKQTDVRLIKYATTGAAANGGAIESVPSGPSLSDPNTANLFQGVQQQILSNPQLLNQVQSLATDPDLQAILSDPSVRQAMDSGDLNTLMNNPKIRALMNNEKIKNISKQVR